MSNTFSVDEVAALAGLTTATILRYIRRKKLPAKRVRGYVIEAQAVRELLAQIAAKPRVHNRKTVIG
jgi:excisionase family DNA binding protein